MNILLANPNTTEAITTLMLAAARTIAAPGTTIHPATAPSGAAVIATRTEAALAQHTTLETLATHAPGMDAAIIAASLDTALPAAREMLPIPVIGITEAALHTACLLGGRFGLITTSPRNAATTREMVEAYGLAPRLAGLRWLNTPSQNILENPEAALPALLEAARALLEQDLADTIILIGAVMAGIPPRLQPHLPIPILEGVTCAIPLAEALVRLHLPKPKSGSYAHLSSPSPDGRGPG